MKYIPIWVNKSWGRSFGFKGSNSKCSVEYNRNDSVNKGKWNRWNVKLNGYFKREDLLNIVFEMEEFIKADIAKDEKDNIRSYNQCSVNEVMRKV